MPYKFADHLLLRMPVKSWDSYRDADLRQLINDPYFRTAIYIASPGFYARLARVDFKYEELTTRERNTIKKYHNRICYRPTPFGLFSSVAPVQWGSNAGFTMGDADKQCIPAVYPDQTYVMAMGQQLLDNELKHNGLYFPNPTLYRAGKEYRFIVTSLDEAFRSRSYDLQSTDHSTLLKRLLQFCEPGKSKPDVVRYIMDNAGCTANEGEDYFQFMADSQLLANYLQPNITGTGYLERLTTIAGKLGIGSERLATVAQLLNHLRGPLPVTPDHFIRLNDRSKNSLPEQVAAIQGDQLNVILKNEAASGALDVAYQQDLADAIFAADQLLQYEPPKAMAHFIKLFKKQFDQQSIPLLKALDPEIGIGYQTPDNERKNPLLETLNIHKRPAENKMTWTPAHRYLLNCWHEQTGGVLPVIRLEKDALQGLKPADDLVTLGMSILFRVVNNKVLIETAGGINAPALLGRFTVADEVIASAARKMALEMEAANPDIIFAELAHLSDPHIDNINRRERVWTRELPITAISLDRKDDQVQLADLYVSVEHDKVVLRSARDKKMVIPRLTSAYNYSINKLPLFYFLADIPYQYSRSNISPDLSRFFPGLSFYPRVEYRNTILCLTTWILNKDDIATLDHEDEQKVIAAFARIAARARLTRVFSLVQGDQQLVFFRDEPDDILLLAESIKNRSEATLKEYLHDDADSSTLKDAEGNNYVSQFNAFFYTAEPLQLLPKAPKPVQARIQRQYILGSDWLYLKIYVPRIAISGLLLKVSPLLKRAYTHGPVKKWFFIRYEDHAPHVRLRLQITPDDLGEVLALFKQKLEKSIYQHVVREYQTDIYSRELERYQACSYDMTETFFWRSSQLIIQMLRAEKRYPESVTPYLFALYSTRDILDPFLPDQAMQVNFTQVNYQGFMREFDDKKQSFELDKKYRELSKQINIAMRDKELYARLGLRTAARHFINSVNMLARNVKKDNGADMHYLSNIIHMHLNRIFIDEPRKQEMVVYYLLHKFLVSDMARKKQAKG